jgi:hypothetical protein
MCKGTIVHVFKVKTTKREVYTMAEVHPDVFTRDMCYTYNGYAEYYYSAADEYSTKNISYTPLLCHLYFDLKQFN